VFVIQVEALSPLLFIFALEYNIGKVLKNQVGLKLNGTHAFWLTVMANLLEDSMNTIRKTLTSIDVSKEYGLEVDDEETKCVMLSRHKDRRQNCDIKIANSSFEKCRSSSIWERQYQINI
jgi:hypothetical protein